MNPCKIVLITLDALSARYMSIYDNKDHFSPFFKEKARTPVIESLLKDSVKYNNAYTNSNMTIVATREILEARMASLKWAEKFSASLPFSDTNLSKILKKQGYKTGAILGSGEGWVFEGFGNEFDWCLKTSIPFDAMIAQGEAWIQNNKNGPFFFWIHSKETHMGFNYQYVDAPYECYNDLAWNELFKSFKESEHTCLKGLPNKNIMLAYAKSITFCDKHIGYLIEYLKKNGLYHESMIIITADHGSTYGDLQTKHYAQHSSAVENVFNIPLVVKYPYSRIQGEENRLCQTIDIPYTIVKETGMDPPMNWEGESLLALTKKHVVMECNPEIKMLGVKTEDWLCQYLLPSFYLDNPPDNLKYIIDSLKPFLFLTDNPTKNVYQKSPEIIAKVEEILKDYLEKEIHESKE